MRRTPSPPPPPEAAHTSHTNNNNNRTTTTTTAGRQRIHRRIFKTALLVHVASLLACAAASGLSQGTNDTLSEEKETTSPCRNTPIHLHHAQSNSSQCVVWSSSESPRELCSVDTTSRVQRLKATYLFPQLQPISLYEVLAAGSGDRDVPSYLRAGVEGADCLSESKNKCEACFRRLATSLSRLDEAYSSFDRALLRFDCLPAVDTASATRPFSPNGSCTTCRSWYRRWLLVQTVSLWRAPPCVNWCYYAQLACPHLATSKVVDYAGHPSFQCRDLDIPSSHQTVSRCACLHPCDLRGVVDQSDHPRSDLHDAPHDFYAAAAHCRARERQCSTAHDRRPRQGGSLEENKGSSSSPASLLLALLSFLLSS